MPCLKCSSGKWKYGANGNCQFDTLAACKAAAAAIHIHDKSLDAEDTDCTKSMLDTMRDIYSKLPT